MQEKRLNVAKVFQTYRRGESTQQVLSSVFSIDHDNFASIQGRRIVRVHGAFDNYSLSAVHDIAYLKNGHMVSVDGDNNLRVWDPKSNCINTLQLGSMGYLNNYKLAVLKNDQVISYCNNTLKILDKVWDKKGTQWEVQVNGNIRSIAILSEHLIGICYQSKAQIEIWDLKQGKYVNTLAGHNGDVLALTVSYYDQLISSSADKTVRIWDVNEGKCIHTLEGHKEAITALHYSSLEDGLIVTASPDKVLKVWKKLRYKEGWHCANTVECDDIVTAIYSDISRQIITLSGEIVKRWPKKIMFAPKDWADLENKLLCKALEEKKAETLDFSKVILPNLHLSLVAKSLKRFTHWKKVVNMCPYNDEGFEPIATFIDDPRIEFDTTVKKLADISSQDGGTILHYLIRLYVTDQHDKSAIEKLMLDCISLGVDKLKQDKNGKIAAQLASEMKAENLALLLQANRPALDLPQLVLDWCTEQKWTDVVRIDGSRAEMVLVDETITTRRSTPPKTQILSVQNISTAKRNVTQTISTTIHTEQQVSIKLDRTLAYSNKALAVQTKNKEQLDTQRNQTTDSTSEEDTHASSSSAVGSSTSTQASSLARNSTSTHTASSQQNSSSSDSLQRTARSVESKNWHASGTASVTSGFIFVSANISATAGGGGSSEHSNEQTSIATTSNSQSVGNAQSDSKSLNIGTTQSDRNTRSDTDTLQMGRHKTQSSQSTQAKEDSERNSEGSRAEQENQNQFSTASGEQQRGVRHWNRKKENSTIFREGYHYINSEKKFTWTEYKKINMQYALGGQVGIYRSLAGEMTYVPLYTILNGKKSMLNQVYRDYDWQFDPENSEVSCTIVGNYVEHNAVTEMFNEEHPLYRIKRLIDELVTEENDRRTKLIKNDQIVWEDIAWMVNVTVNDNKINPYAGTIEVRCSDNTNTRFLKNALKQIVHFSGEVEYISPTTKDTGFKLFTLTFNLQKKASPTLTANPATTNPKPGTHSGLTRVNSGEFKFAFFNQKQKNQTVYIVMDVLNEVFKVDAQNNPKVIWFEVDKTILQLRFDPQRLTNEHKHKIHINALLLALVAFLEYTNDKLPEPERLKITGQWAYCIDFFKLNESTIKTIDNPINHKYLVDRFKQLFLQYLKEFESVSPEKLREKKEKLYQELRESSQQEISTPNFDF